MNSADSFTIGKVTGVHGLNGNLKVWSFAQSVDTFGAGSMVLLKTENRSGKNYRILNATAYKKGVLLSLEGVDDRNSAEDLVGCEIRISRDQLPEPEEDSWFWQDLIGLKVVDESRGDLGVVADIFPTGANDVLVVRPGNRKSETGEILVPMHRHFVRDVNLDNQVLTTRLPEDYE